MPLGIGSRAPDFVAPDESGGSFSLGEAVRSGPVLLIFYPADWGFVCRSEILEFRDRQPAYEEMGIRLVGLSTNLVISHAVWSDNLKLRFPLLSDPPGAIAAAFGVLDLAEESFNKGRTKRALFLVDRERRIAYSWCTENQWLEPDYDEVEAACRLAAAPLPIPSRSDALPAEGPGDAANPARSRS